MLKGCTATVQGKAKPACSQHSHMAALYSSSGIPWSWRRATSLHHSVCALPANHLFNKCQIVVPIKPLIIIGFLTILT